MASGCPMIAPDLPNVREILDENMCIFVTPGDSKAYAEAIEEKDSSVARKKSNAALAEASKYRLRNSIFGAIHNLDSARLAAQNSSRTLQSRVDDTLGGLERALVTA